MNDCEKWLFDYLTKNGTTNCEVVREEARKCGFKKSELKQARKNLGVKCWNDRAIYGETLNWFWYLD